MNESLKTYLNDKSDELGKQQLSEYGIEIKGTLSQALLNILNGKKQFQPCLDTVYQFSYAGNLYLLRFDVEGKKGILFLEGSKRIKFLFQVWHSLLHSSHSCFADTQKSHQVSTFSVFPCQQQSSLSVSTQQKVMCFPDLLGNTREVFFLLHLYFDGMGCRCFSTIIPGLNQLLAKQKVCHTFNWIVLWISRLVLNIPNSCKV